MAHRVGSPKVLGISSLLFRVNIAESNWIVAHHLVGSAVNLLRNTAAARGDDLSYKSFHDFTFVIHIANGAPLDAVEQQVVIDRLAQVKMLGTKGNRWTIACID